MTTARSIWTPFIAMIYLACNTSTTTNKRTPTRSDTNKIITEESLNLDKNKATINKIKTEIIAKNKANYSDNGYEKFELKDSLLLVNGKDTVYFPSAPKVGKVIVLTGRKNNLAISLTIKRINYTTIDYKIEMVEFGKKRHNQSGQADLISSFFFGAESDINETTGNEYFVSEFNEYKNNECYTLIRLGYEKTSGPYLLGKVKKNCNDKFMDVDLENFPTLIEK
jgi:hypothetical protein